MRRIALLAAAIGGLTASNSLAALAVKLVNGTSSNQPANSDVYFITLTDTTGANPAIQAQSVVATAASGTLLFPDGDEFGGVGTGSSATAIAQRGNPDGTFAFLPSATNVATNPTGADFSSGHSTGFSAQSFRVSSPYQSSTPSFILGALVLSKGDEFSMNVTVNPTLNDATAVNFSFGFPEPAGLASAGLALLGVARRRRRN